METILIRFITVLKQHGVTVSPAEALDALRALAAVGLDERETVRTVLCSTLVKDQQTIPLFEQLFEFFFGAALFERDPQAQQAATLPGALELAESAQDERTVSEHGPVEFAAVELESAEAAHAHAAPEQEGVDLSLSGQQLLLSQHKDRQPTGYKPTFRVHTRQLPGAVRGGELSSGDTGEELDIEGTVEALLEDLRDLEVDQALLEALERQLAAGMSNLPDLLRRYRRRAALLRQRTSPQAANVPRPDYQFSEHERREMDAMIRRLGRKMRGALSYRRSINHRGRINLSRTIRANLKYDSVPFFPVLSIQRDERPRLVVICDVSLSVRNTARFMLHLVHSLQTLFSKVRSFVFVSDLAEITQQVARSSIDEAIDMVFSGLVIDVEANSNYGRALEIFYERHLAAVSSRTTVIVLGDGRGNRNPPNAWILEVLRRSCKQLIWLTPEQRGAWQLSGSDMLTYAPICHKVEVVRNLDQLGRVTEDLMRSALTVRR